MNERLKPGRDVLYLIFLNLAALRPRNPFMRWRITLDTEASRKEIHFETLLERMLFRFTASSLTSHAEKLCLIYSRVLHRGN